MNRVIVVVLAVVVVHVLVVQLAKAGHVKVDSVGRVRVA